MSEIILARQIAGRCAYCGIMVWGSATGISGVPDGLACLNGKPVARACFDHVIPRANGGSSKRENLKMACIHCNSMKGKMCLDEWRKVFAQKVVGIPVFTEVQEKYLMQNGVSEGVVWKYREVKFHFETEKDPVIQEQTVRFE